MAVRRVYRHGLPVELQSRGELSLLQPRHCLSPPQGVAKHGGNLCVEEGDGRLALGCRTNSAGRQRRRVLWSLSNGTASTIRAEQTEAFFAAPNCQMARLG